MNESTLMLIDISGLAHATFHVSGNEPDPSFISNTLIARVRALASQHPHAAICCDSGKSFRHDLDPQYKAGRSTENRAVIKHQLDVALDTLRNDGFPVWSVKGMEADDLIGTSTRLAVEMDPDVSVVIVSADKDLTQLVSDRVTMRKFDGTVVAAADVFDKFGVKPEQMGDLLALMGDASDNIKGAEKIGKTIGARLLSEHGTLERLYAEMANGVVSGVTPTMRTNLMEFKARWPTVRQLIALKTDVAEVSENGSHFQFAEIATERVPAPMEVKTMEHEPSLLAQSEAAAHGNGDERVPFERGHDANDAPLPFGRELSDDAAQTAAGNAMKQAAERVKNAEDRKPPQSMVQMAKASGEAAYAPITVAPSAPVDFSQQLEPRTMTEAKQLAQLLFDSRLFSAYGQPQAVLATILAGREFGMSAMASLRGHHIIEGKTVQSADTIAGIVLSSKKAKYFKPTQRSATVAAFKTLRIGEDEDAFELAYTIEEAKLAWKKDQKAWDNSGWGKNPTDMLVARAKAKLARLIYPDVVGGMYAPEEFD